MQKIERIREVVVDRKVPHALHRDASSHLPYCSCLKILVSLHHNQADALLPQSEEGKAHDEVGGLDEAVIGQEVLVGALREEDLVVTEFGLNDRGVHIVA